MESNRKYLVSIVVPVYNAEKYLRAAFNSVRKQTIGFRNIQLILVDDCSKDRSYSLIRGWAKRYSNIVFLQTPQGSGSASEPRNIGLSAAEADYVMFLDADDVLRPNAVELLYNLITTHNVDLADAAFKELGSVAEIDGRYRGKKEGIYSINDESDELFVMVHPIWTKIYKRSIIESNNLTFDITLRNGEDSRFLFQYMLHAKDVWHVNQVVYEYRVLDGSVSHDRTLRYYKELADACTAIKRDLSSSPLTAYLHRYIEEIAVSSLEALCDSANISDEGIKGALLCWYPFMKYIAQNRLNSKTALGEILVRDAERDDYDAFEHDFFELRCIYVERRQLFQGIFSSRGWKLITFINKLLRRG